jgi:hypothetical protein
MIVRRALLALLFLLTLGWVLLPAPRASAHGGVVIKTGTFEQYEYLVQIYPYPAQVGVGVVSLFLFDYHASGPAIGFTGDAFLTPPGVSDPCCQTGLHRGPYVLTTDPVFYPGDYTAYLPIDAAGQWQVTFRIQREAEAFELSAPLDVAEPAANQEVNPAAIATNAALMTNVAVDMQSSTAMRSVLGGPAPTPGQSTSPLALASPLMVVNGPTTASSNGPGAVASLSSPLPSQFVGWAWLGMGAVVVIGAWFSIWRLQHQE